MTKRQSGLSALTRHLLRVFTDVDMVDSIVEDMEDRYAGNVERKGCWHARSVWIGKLAIVFTSFAIKSFSWRTIMLKNYLKLTIRTIRRNKIYSFLNITGLAIGLAIFIIIALYGQYEWSFDKHHGHSDRIYRILHQSMDERIKREPSAYTPAPLAPAIVDIFPEVESAARITCRFNIPVVFGDNRFFEEIVYFAENEAFEIFSIPFLTGDPKRALSQPSTIVLSERMAQKYFGGDDPVGKTLMLKGSLSYTVTGIIENMPENSHLSMDFIMPFVEFFRFLNLDPQSWATSNYYSYILLREGILAEEFERKLNDNIYRGIEIEERRKKTFYLQPLSSIHLQTDVIHEIRDQIDDKKDSKYLLLFSTSALLMLILACINYMNLATARSVQRSKEVGMRKVVGASRGQLARQFLGESLFFSFLALVAAVIIVFFTLPVFNNFIQRPLRFDLAENHALILVLVSVVVFVGLVSGSYPALLISSFKPGPILKGNVEKSSKAVAMRNLLVVVQFAVTIVFIIGSFIVRDQLLFIRTTDMGYDREQIITLAVKNDRNVRQNIETIKTELKRNPKITAVSASSYLPNYNESGINIKVLPGKNPGEYVPIYGSIADYDYVDVFGLDIVEGRNFSREFASDTKGAILINESAADACKWESPVGKEVSAWGIDNLKIVGIIEDFHFRSLHEPIGPLFVILSPTYAGYISIKMDMSDFDETMAYVEKTMKNFAPGLPFEYRFFNETVERMYTAEQKIAQMYGCISVITIIIACLGIFGLSTSIAERRTKEIGVRKVLGASVLRITALLGMQFVKLVLIANLIAWPIAFIIMNHWLQNFVYRTDIKVWVFLLSAFVALAVALMTVSFQSVKAALANPMDSLRYE